LELEKAAKHGAQRGVKIKKMWDSADGYAATVRLPICSERTRVDLARLRVSVDQPDGVVLYLIGRFLPRDMPGATDQIAFDRKIVAAGIADEDGRGPRFAELNEMLRRRRTKAG
jgi:hypothetical protein